MNIQRREGGELWIVGPIYLCARQVLRHASLLASLHICLDQTPLRHFGDSTSTTSRCLRSPETTKSMTILPVPSDRADVLRIGPFFFFNDTATTEIYTLSLHDALPI